MTCSYCGSRNGEGEHRCQRCGRRPNDNLTVNVGALATKPLFSPEYVPLQMPELLPESKSANLANARQRSLQFQDRAESNVIPFESYAPAAPSKSKTTTARTSTRPQVRRRRVSEDQGTLDFLPALPPAPRVLSTTVNAVVVCEAPVATPLHRAVAAAIDWSLVLIAYGLFLAAYFACGGQFTPDRLNFIVFGSSLLLIGLTYGLLNIVCGRETVGMSCAQLKLTTFDGFKPDATQRLCRFAGSCLSLCTLLGLVWSIWDEENLGWQDHISRTFPTPRDVDTLTFHRR